MLEREDLVTYLATAFAEISRELKVAIADTEQGIGAELDRVYARAGATASDEVVQTLGEYYVLRRLRFAAAPRADFETLNMHPAREQIFQHLSDLLDEVSERLSNLGYPVSSINEYVRGRLQLDYTEPTPEGTDDYFYWPR